MGFRTRAIGTLCAGCIATGIYAWDARSEKVLKPIDAELVEVAWCARQRVPFIVYHGHRTEAEQADFIAKGVTWVRRSKHQDGLAIDVMALDESGKGTWEPKYYYRISEAFYACATIHGTPITWGGEWKKKDMVHIEKKTP